MHHVLLYYKLIKIDNPDKEVRFHKEVCRALQLKGRILIGIHGINGTLSGAKEQIELYKQYMNEHRLFKKIDFKESTSDFEPFPKLQVRVRKEIITTDAETLDFGKKAKYVDRDTFHQWLKSGEDMVLLDMRNEYEWEIGRFVGAIKPPMKYFRDLVDNLDWYKKNFAGKKIVTFCTGGIRCEPATALLVQHGFDPKNIYQLHGGIVKYAEKYGDEGFYEGKCFVFDDRMAVPIDTTENAKIIGNCALCDASCDLFRNCMNRECNKLFIGCDTCMEAYDQACGDECKTIIQDESFKRPAHAGQVHRNK